MTRNILYKKFESIRKFGVELEVSNTVSKTRIKNIIQRSSDYPVEVSNYGKDIGNKYWHIKDDVSCGPDGLFGESGYEIVSYVGSGINDIIHISEVGEAIGRKNVIVNRNCGYHIHTDVSDLNIEQIGVVIAYWLKMEFILSNCLPSHRRNNEYCQYLSWQCRFGFDRYKEYTGTEIWDLFKPEVLTDQDNYERRVNLNLVNYARGVWHSWWQRKTLELRWPEGTLDYYDIKNWLRFYLNFIENVKSLSMPKNISTYGTLNEVLTILGLHHDNNFYIFSEGLLETKIWLLRRIIAFSRGSLVKEARIILNQIIKL